MAFAVPQRLLVLGLGSSGAAVTSWALDRAAEGADVSVTVVDSASDALVAERAAVLTARGADVRLGSTEVVPADLVVASPGIRPSAPVMTAARELGVPMISEIELAYRVSVAPWIAITGTNGKTTTTALVTHLLREAGFAAEAAGNIGPPSIGVATDLGTAGVIVAEVSSFQLMLVDRFHPRVSVLLNITPDHIDYHGSLEAYASDKARVFARQLPGDTAVIDIDDEGSRPHADLVEARGIRVVRVSRQSTPAGGAYVRDSVLVLHEDGAEVALVPASELRIRGDHNVSNALAGAAAARAMGAGIEALREGLRSFEPIEHRLEPAGTVDGVEYFNDSKATNPDAVIKALTAFGDRGIVLLLGGRNKGVAMRPLAETVSERCGAVVLFGEAASEFEAAFAGLPIPTRTARDLAGAVGVARSFAHEGDAVVLSPGCTSFDEFGGYEERGRRFKAIVASLSGAGE
jgi:UDP-N-acetylmuramoylalanine--D-glutamate ligase